MTKQVIYKYLGTNGVLETPIHLEDIFYVRMMRLVAAENKILSNGSRRERVVTVPENEVAEWTEIALDTIN